MEQQFNIAKYLDMANRRKWWIIIPFLLTLLGGLTFIIITPKIYESESLILVYDQKVPKDFVREIVSSDLEERLASITQQIKSRTNLEKIIKDFRIPTQSITDMTTDEKVELIRKRIVIEISRGVKARGTEANAFTIRFRDENPRKAAEVTNSLASNFISENLKIRESQALGTSTFVSDELTNIQRRLLEKEDELKQYREKYMGGLPGQLDANLAALGRLQSQMDQLHTNLRDAENRKLVIQRTIEEAKKEVPVETVQAPGQAAPAAPGQAPVPMMDAEERDLDTMKKTLVSLEAKYTERHPDVLRLKKTIEKFEAEKMEKSRVEAEKLEAEKIEKATLEEEKLEADKTEKDKSGKETKPSSTPSLAESAKRERVVTVLGMQLDQVERQMADLKEEIARVVAQIKAYQAKVEDTPRREQELFSLNRDYENLKSLYNSFSSRKLEAEIAVSLERKQKGEQFQVIDPAKAPLHPVEPNILRIIMMTIVLALGLGGGLAFLMETLDTSFKTPDEVEKDLHIPVLISMPMRYTAPELRRQKRRQILAAAVVAVAFLLSAVSVVIYFKGVESPINLVRDLLSRL